MRKRKAGAAPVPAGFTPKPFKGQGGSKVESQLEGIGSSVGSLSTAIERYISRAAAPAPAPAPAAPPAADTYQDQLADLSESCPENEDVFITAMAEVPKAKAVAAMVKRFHANPDVLVAKLNKLLGL